MISKSQSISVRLSEDDYAYLMAIRQNGALTQSDKVRELIAMAREAVGTESFARSFITASDSIAPYRARYKSPESGRSVLNDAVFDLLTESAALIQSLDGKSGAADLERQLFPVLTDLLRRLLPVLLTGSGGHVLNADQAELARQQLLNDFSHLNNATRKE